MGTGLQVLDSTTKMSVMVTGKELADAVNNGTFIHGGNAASVEGVKYDLRLSNRILKAKFGRPIDAAALTEAEKRDLRVEPGEVVFALTEERLVLPMDMFVQLSPKRKLSHAGILTLGGFCVDPGYAGHLLVGLFNLSSSPFQLWPGKKLIGATFFRLEQNEQGEFPARTEPLDEFPEELVEVMQKYQPLAIQAVSESVQRLQTDLASLRTEIRSHEDRYNRFWESLEAHNKQIGTLSADLSAEAAARKAGEDKLTEAVQSVKDTLSFLKGMANTVTIMLGIAMTFFVTWLIWKLGWGS